MTNIAVVGTGMMGKLHTRVWKELGQKPVLYDTNIAESFKLAQEHALLYYDNLKYVLSGHKPEIVSIAVPTPSHVEVARQCLEAGANVLLEKPISDNVEESKNLVELADKLNLTLAVGYIENFNPAFTVIKKLYDAGVFGEVTSINIKRVGGIPRSADNVILDLMTHDIGLLITLFNKKPDYVVKHHRYNTDSDIIDSSQALMGFGKASATCESNWISPIKIRKINVTGTGGYCEADLINQTVTWFGEEPGSTYLGYKDKIGEIHTYQFRKEPLKEELSNFLEYVTTDNKDENLIVSGHRALDILEVTLDVMNYTR
jgi:UDP-N-acetylglucosamine 3-dehydrogenase